MIGEEIAPGLRRWMTSHEEWGEDVGSVSLRRGEDLVLVDPLLSDEQLEGFEPPEDASLHILLTTHYHARSTAEIVARHPGTRVWAHAPDAAPIRRRAPVTDLFRPAAPLPGGLQAHAVRPRTEVVLWDAAAGALIPGDVLLGAKDGGVRMCPASWLPQSATIAELREKLEPLLDLLPVEMLLVSHGDPVLSGGRQALAKALR